MQVFYKKGLGEPLPQTRESKVALQPGEAPREQARGQVRMAHGSRDRTLPETGHGLRPTRHTRAAQAWRPLAPPGTGVLHA